MMAATATTGTTTAMAVRPADESPELPPFEEPLPWSEVDELVADADDEDAVLDEAEICDVTTTVTGAIVEPSDVVALLVVTDVMSSVLEGVEVDATTVEVESNDEEVKATLDEVVDKSVLDKDVGVSLEDVEAGSVVETEVKDDVAVASVEVASVAVESVVTEAMFNSPREVVREEILTGRISGGHGLGCCSVLRAGAAQEDKSGVTRESARCGGPRRQPSGQTVAKLWEPRRTTAIV